LQEKAVSHENELCERCGNCRERTRKRHPRSSADFSLARLQSTLPLDTALVEYYSSGDRLIAAVVTRETIKITAISVVSGSIHFLHLLRFQLSKFRMGTAYAHRFEQPLLSATQSHLEALYAELIAPIPRHLNAKHLIFVPTALCTFFPSMLCDMAMNTSATRTRFPMRPARPFCPLPGKKTGNDMANSLVMNP